MSTKGDLSTMNIHMCTLPSYMVYINIIHLSPKTWAWQIYLRIYFFLPDLYFFFVHTAHIFCEFWRNNAPCYDPNVFSPRSHTEARNPYRLKQSCVLKRIPKPLP